MVQLFPLQIDVLYVIVSLMESISLTRHAKNRMRLHGITESDVVAALEYPEFLEPSTGDRMNAWVRTSDKYLRVTYKDEINRILVITAAKKRAGWR
jgi:hypothetical protein